MSDLTSPDLVERLDQELALLLDRHVVEERELVVGGLEGADRLRSVPAAASMMLSTPCSMSKPCCCSAMMDSIMPANQGSNCASGSSGTPASAAARFRPLRVRAEQRRRGRGRRDRLTRASVRSLHLLVADRARIDLQADLLGILPGLGQLAVDRESALRQHVHRAVDVDGVFAAGHRPERRLRARGAAREQPRPCRAHARTPPKLPVIHRCSPIQCRFPVPPSLPSVNQRYAGGRVSISNSSAFCANCMQVEGVPIRRMSPGGLRSGWCVWPQVSAAHARVAREHGEERRRIVEHQFVEPAAAVRHRLVMQADERVGVGILRERAVEPLELLVRRGGRDSRRRPCCRASRTARRRDGARSRARRAGSRGRGASPRPRRDCRAGNAPARRRPRTACRAPRSRRRRRARGRRSAGSRAGPGGGARACAMQRASVAPVATPRTDMPGCAGEMRVRELQQSHRARSVAVVVGLERPVGGDAEVALLLGASSIVSFAPIRSRCSRATFSSSFFGST